MRRGFPVPENFIGCGRPKDQLIKVSWIEAGRLNYIKYCIDCKKLMGQTKSCNKCKRKFQLMCNRKFVCAKCFDGNSKSYTGGGI